MFRKLSGKSRKDPEACLLHDYIVTKGAKGRTFPQLLAVCVTQINYFVSVYL